MEKLSELNAQLSAEKKKPKNARNKAFMHDVQEQIFQQKAILKNGYQDRRMEKRKAEVDLCLSLWKKKSEKYAKTREERKKARIEKERKLVEKIQQKKKAK